MIVAIVVLGVVIIACLGIISNMANKAIETYSNLNELMSKYEALNLSIHNHMEESEKIQRTISEILEDQNKVLVAFVDPVNNEDETLNYN